MHQVGILVRIRLVRHLTMVIAQPMSFKLNFNSTESFALPNHAVIRISGPDAKTFLQSQCMNDVNALAECKWQYNGWLNPQGRVMALFYLIERDAMDYQLILPALPAESLISALSRFVFRSKVSIQVDTGHWASGQLFGNAETELSHQKDHAVPSVIELVIPGGQYRRTLTLTSSPAPANEEAFNLWHVLDMMSGWPWINASLQGIWTPHMLSLQSLAAFSVKKGCYPGQEIVARTHFLGKNKRKLYFIQGLELSEGSPVISAGNEIGKVVNVERHRKAGLAVLPSETLPDDMCNEAGAIRVEKPEIC